jgi:hypothetical protein
VWELIPQVESAFASKPAERRSAHSTGWQSAYGVRGGELRSANSPEQGVDGDVRGAGRVVVAELPCEQGDELLQ